MKAATPVRNRKKPSASMKQASIFSFFSKANAKNPNNDSNKDTNKDANKGLNKDANQDEDTVTMPNSPPDTCTKASAAMNTPETPSRPEKRVSRVQLSTPSSSETEEVQGNNTEDSGASSDEEDTIRVKRRRVTKKNSDVFDSEDEFVPEDEEEDEDEDDAYSDMDVDDDDDEEEIVKPKRKPAKQDPSPSADFDEDELLNQLLDADEQASSEEQGSTKDKMEKYKASSDYVASLSKPAASKNHLKGKNASSAFKKQNEERYQWLVTVRDAAKRLETDPEYDPRTLYIPQTAWSSFTAFEKQYWEIKSKMWDCVVFFKKGKFYELYEKDAMIAHTEFDLKLAGTGRANMQLAGIPEMSFDYWAAQFIEKGYKVAKVDQKETLLAKEMKERASGKKEAAKVIHRELTGVLTGGTLTNETMLSSDMATYCFAIKQEDNSDNTSDFGVCFTDVSTGHVFVTQFHDDAELTQLETLVSQIRPKEILVEKGNLSSLATRVIKNNLANRPIWNVLKPEEFWNSEITQNELRASKYGAHAIKLCENASEITTSALGAMVYYLRTLSLDEQVFSMNNFNEYRIHENNTAMVLDGQTLRNLEVFADSFDGSSRGTLFQLLNHAVSPMGKRLLKTWVCRPLLNKDMINKRLDAVDAILSDVDLMQELDENLRSLPDLERMLARIHSGTLRPKDFARAVAGFIKIHDFLSSKSSTQMPGVLGDIWQQVPKELSQVLLQWHDAFDSLKAQTEDVLIPKPGVEPEFDESVATQRNFETELLHLLNNYKQKFCSEVCYKDSGKEIYTIEVPTKMVKKIPKDWQTMGATTKTKRYWSPEVKELVQQLLEARESHKDIERQVKNKLYAKFDEKFEIWQATVEAIASIDCVLSLAKASQCLGAPSCRPEFLDSEFGELDFEELRHPCFAQSGKEFVPNDVKLGGDSAKLGLLTGANAAGKSTVLRMTCIAVILAQLGCYVPAKSAKLTPMDRVMTRLGANDNIMQGKSTFFVELSETKKMLEMATPKSLLVLDELGRGGSSSDGFAIAESVLYHVATHIQAVGFFATHYGNLGQSFVGHKYVQPMRMAIMVDSNSRDVTFLYKLEKGAAAGSFGMNVAAMCGIDSSIVDIAEKAAKELESTSGGHMSLSDVPMGLQSDFSRFLSGGLSQNPNGSGEGCVVYNESVRQGVLDCVGGIVSTL